MAAVISLIVIGLLAVGFAALVLVRSAGPSNEGSGLGNNSPYPDNVLPTPPWFGKPPLGTPESLTSHPAADWIGTELRHATRRHRDDRD